MDNEIEEFNMAFKAIIWNKFVKYLKLKLEVINVYKNNYMLYRPHIETKIVLTK